MLYILRNPTYKRIVIDIFKNRRAGTVPGIDIRFNKRRERIQFAVRPAVRVKANVIGISRE